LLSYVDGSLKNVTVTNGKDSYQGFIFSLLNPPVPLGGNIISLDIYLDEIPIPKKSIFIETSEDVVNATTLSENRPISFKPFQSGRFLIIKDGGMEEKRKHKVVILSKLQGFEQIMIPFTFSDYISTSREIIFIPSEMLDDDAESNTDEVTIFKNFISPLILSGKKAYIVCSSNGEISAKWSWMGVTYDNGGLYVPPARSFGRIVIEISMDEGVRKRLPNFVVSSKHEKGVLYTRHFRGSLQVKRKLFVPRENKGLVMKLELAPLDKRSEINFQKVDLEKKIKKHYKIRVHFLIDGNITSYGLAAISQSNLSRLVTKDNCLQIQTAFAKKNLAHYYGTIGVAPKSLRPSKVIMDSFDNNFEISYDVEIEAGRTSELALVAAGSFTSSEECLKEYLYIRDNYNQLLGDLQNHFNKTIASSTLNLAHPPLSSNHTSIIQQEHQHSTIVKLLKAFEKAKTSLEYLKADYDELGVGICAGLPRFPNFWARDTGWPLRGYLSMGDYNFAIAIIENFLRHQAKKNSTMALKGELPMIISGKAFLHNTTFGSADSTFLFPWAIREYVFATGNIHYLQKRWNSIIDLVNWGFLKDTDGDGFVEHGFAGVAEKLPIQDSTWMDHIDRRKSANDVQALFYESLKIGSELATIVGDEHNKEKWTRRAEKLRDQIDIEYWDTKTGFYYDTIRKDNTKDSSVRPNALVLLLTESVRDRLKADSVLRRIEENDVTTAWGVRTLSSLDSKYHPTLYHDGAVWPLVTGWAAVSELKYGRKEQALYYLECMAARILSENGMYAETYRGDRPQPFNSCILQAWSVGMYVYALREMMLGMSVNMIENKIQFEPQFPESLRNYMIPINFEYSIPNAEKEQSNRLQIVVNPNREEIDISFKSWNLKTTPVCVSNSYRTNIEN
jgi:predicted glycogen debranching enzyme